MSAVSVLREVRRERTRQDELHGFPVLADGTSDEWPEWERVLAAARAANDSGNATWATILMEEVAEALLERDRAAIRAELIQIAAVAVKWTEAIDRDQEAS